MSMNSGTGPGATPVKEAAAEVAQTAKQEASHVASSASDNAKQMASEATTQAKAVAQQAKEQVTTLLDQTKTELRHTADQQGQKAASSLRTVADQLRSLAEGHPDQAGQLQHYVQQAQDKVQSFATRLENEGPQALLQDATRFARQRPVVFLAAAAGAGFAIGRLVRAGAAASGEQNGVSGHGSNGAGNGSAFAGSAYSSGAVYTTPELGAAPSDLAGVAAPAGAQLAPPSAPAPMYHGMPGTAGNGGSF